MISVVDDDPSVRKALRRLLQSAGYSVEAFASGPEFLASDSPGRIACLVLDIRLDGMTGFELQERLVADRTAVPVIFITAHDDVRTRERVQKAGAAAYLAKPFEAAALLAAVESAAGPA
jgi:FixJ family two-component response regulator